MKWYWIIFIIFIFLGLMYLSDLELGYIKLYLELQN